MKSKNIISTIQKSVFLLIFLFSNGLVFGQVTFSAGGLPAAIPDPGNLSNTITVSGLPGTVATADEVQINVAISHAWASDIVIGVTPPGGTEIIIVNRIGGGMNIDMNSANVLSFRANAAAVVTVPGLNGIIPAGIYLPSGANAVGSFSSFVGATRNGNWIIRVRDDDSIIQGSLQSASISFFDVVPSCPSFSNAPENVSITNSTCVSNVVSGGIITAPAGTPCPTGSVLQYQVNSGSWDSSLPTYDQTGPAQSIITRCSCASDPQMTSTESTPVVTVPGICTPAIVLTCPSNTTVAACQTQAAVNSAFATWLASASGTGGCNGVFTNNNTGAPPACGGSTTVTFTYTSTCAPLITTCQAVFTVPAAPAIVLTCPSNTTVAACQTQAAVNSAFATWLASASGTGGCNGVLSNNNTGAPAACGGSTTVTFTYTSTCAPLSTTCQATFTVPAAPTIVLTCPINTTVAACQTQAAVNAQFAAWLATASASGGCNGVLTNNNTGAPSSGGGSTTVTFTYTSTCTPLTTTCQATFTVAASPTVVLTCPTNTTAAACQTQSAVNAQFAVWLATASGSGGCNGVLTNNNTGAPAATGGSTTVTFTYTSTSSPVTTTCQSSFTVPSPTLPCGWSAEPNGAGCTSGSSVAYNTNTQRFTVTSTKCYYSGSFSSDALAFAQYDLCGNGSITAQVTSITGGQGWAGITMRESNAAGAKKAQLMTNLSTLSRREFRTATGGQAYPQQFPSQNRYWLRITRTGNQFVMSISQNGTSWYPAGAQNITMSSCIEMGLVVTNYNSNSTITATFANVSVSGGSVTKPVINPKEDILAVADFSIMPNPSNGWIEIDLSSYGQRKVQLDMYNLQGKLLQTTNIETVRGKEEIDLTSFANGMYLIRVRAEGLPDVTKRVVMNSNR